MISHPSSLHWEQYDALQKASLSSVLQSWLLYSGSFMQRLKERGTHDATIQIISQSWQYAEPWENKALNIDLSAEALVREVIILSETKYWMFARSVFPRSFLTGEEAQLAHLDTRPLGTILFNHPHMQRSNFAYTCLKPQQPWYQKIIDIIPDAGITSDLWARYSLFHLEKKSLLLTEVFLPDVLEQ